MPKAKNSVWRHFECLIKNKNSTGKWAKCRECSKEMQGIPSRMEKHISTHQKNTSNGPSSSKTTEDSVPDNVLPSTSTTNTKGVNISGMIIKLIYINLLL